MYSKHSTSVTYLAVNEHWSPYQPTDDRETLAQHRFVVTEKVAAGNMSEMTWTILLSRLRADIDLYQA